MKRLLIIQNKILHYRKPVYNALSEYYKVSVLQSGLPSVQHDDRYQEIIVPVRKIGPFFIQSFVLKEVIKTDYDIIIAMFDIRWINNIFLAFLPLKKRIIYWGHGYGMHHILNILRDWLIRRADAVLLYGNEPVEKMISRGISTDKIFIAPNTLYVQRPSDTSTKEKDSFLFIGRAQKRKKVDVLIQAFSKVIEQLPSNTKIDIVGAGPENDQLRSLAHELSIDDRVIFHGEVIEEEALRVFFQNAYAYVSPGPVGLGVLHSFAYGVPVVTNRLGKHGPEYCNLLHQGNALIYDTDKELEDILVMLTRNKDLSERLGTNAYQHYTQHRTLEHMVNGFIEAIEDKPSRLLF